jgi:hypothetical protein
MKDVIPKKFFRMTKNTLVLIKSNIFEKYILCLILYPQFELFFDTDYGLFDI